MATDNHERVYDFICRFVDEHRIPPTRQEISDGIGLSKTSIQLAIDILEARGKVKRERFKSRAIMPIKR
jgi:SOS-response transcriptional repressor LexA